MSLSPSASTSFRTSCGCHRLAAPKPMGYAPLVPLEFTASTIGGDGGDCKAATIEKPGPLDIFAIPSASMFEPVWSKRTLWLFESICWMSKVCAVPGITFGASPHTYTLGHTREVFPVAASSTYVDHSPVTCTPFVDRHAFAALTVASVKFAFCSAITSASHSGAGFSFLNKS